MNKDQIIDDLRGTLERIRGYAINRTISSKDEYMCWKFVDNLATEALKRTRIRYD